MNRSTLAALLLLAACGGSGVPEDTLPTDPPLVGAEGIDRFLLFPNPQVQDDGRFQTDTEAYALAYYAAVDPAGERDTLPRWLAKNGFGQAGGEEVLAVFGDTRDLGYGRRMLGRRNADGTLAFVVENYLVNPGGGYGDTPLSIEAAAARDTRWRVGINAIEFSTPPGQPASAPYAKFFNFNPATGARETTVDLDGRGRKALPGVCLNCHGGRGDALSADGRFRGPKNSASADGGDALGKLHAFEVSGFRFLDRSPWRRGDQEAALKRLNQFVLCSWPQPPAGQASGVPTTLCTRRTASDHEWQGSAAPLLIGAYGGDGLPNASYADNLLPAGWLGQEALYRSVVAPACRTCHLMRGTGLQSDIDFDDFAKFQGYAGRIRAHAVDRGNMPLAKIVYDAYWSSDAPQRLATFLEAAGETGVRDAAGAPLRPGRPVADPGPGRAAQSGTDVFLSARNSLGADAWQWTLDAPVPAGAALSGANQREAVLRAGVGDHFLTLRVSRGGVQSEPVTLRVAASAAAPNQNEVTFAQVRAAVGACTGCHASGPANTNPVAFDTADPALYAELRSRINFSDIVASPLLRKPSGEHHGGAAQPGFLAASAPGSATRTQYDLILNWALRGAPP